MKLGFIFSVFFVIVPISIYGQFSDESTIAIQQYFNGEYNPVSAELVTVSRNSNGLSSEVTVIQSGNENNVYIRSLQTGDQQEVLQNGENNNFEFYNYYSQENSSMQVNQNGTSNSLQVFGENSLMKDAVIHQKSDFNTIVVRNYSN
jgi:hypothetical protein